MIFKSIRLQNFRQYKKELKLDFSLPNQDKKTITLFIAANGVGKTTLLQAVRYCFYGESNYLHLPRSSELINNKLVDELKELEETTLFVEVEFQHNNVQYVATRERSFIKQSGKMRPVGEEGFVIRELTKKDGYKKTNADAMVVIRNILPEGLSQVFMFDGERMEQNISDKDFSKDLKSSIIGILDIYKYSKLIDILGSLGKSSTVLGMLNNKKKADTPESRSIQKNYQQLLVELESDQTRIEEINEEIGKIEREINVSKDKQAKLEELKSYSQQRDIIEKEIRDLEEKVNEKAQTYIKSSHDALIYKRLLEVHNDYKQYISKNNQEHNYYSNLHIKTIEDVIERGICICGRPIDDHPEAIEHLKELKKTSLPIETAQYINSINQKFNSAMEFKENLEKLSKSHSEIVDNRKLIKNHQKRKNDIEEEIKKIEKLIGVSFEDEIEQLMTLKSKLHEELGSKRNHLGLVEKSIEKYKKEIEKLDDSNDKNKKIQNAIEDVLYLKDEYSKDLDSLDAKAREVLGNHFDQSIGEVLTGKYKVGIDDKYNISIRDLITNKDVTAVLSTGQNVVVSLSFIDALIKTAKQLTSRSNEKYGVLMDAAMSNLDEAHIEKLCQTNLNQLDQLIFLSFKRQLRDEMFLGIKNQIGKAYHLVKDGNVGVTAKEIPLNILEDYIHNIEEGDYE